MLHYPPSLFSFQTGSLLWRMIGGVITISEKSRGILETSDCMQIDRKKYIQFQKNPSSFRLVEYLLLFISLLAPGADDTVEFWPLVVCWCLPLICILWSWLLLLWSSPWLLLEQFALLYTPRIRSLVVCPIDIIITWYNNNDTTLQVVAKQKTSNKTKNYAIINTPSKKLNFVKTVRIENF